jgi:hypothetical protein
MKKFIVILLFSFSLTQAQSTNSFLYKIQLKGGINYLYNNEHISFFNGYSEINKNQPGFFASFKIHFLLDIQSSILFGIEFIEANTYANSNFSRTEWIFHGYPISIEYQYGLNIISEKIKPFISAGIFFILSTEQRTNDHFLENRIESFSRIESGFGVDGNVGLTYLLNSKFELLSELKLRYSNASIFTEDSEYTSIEFTGIYFGIGLNYKF